MSSLTSWLQFDQMSVQASQYGDELRVVKGEVAEVNRLIGRLQTEIEAVKAQVSERPNPQAPPLFLTPRGQTTQLLVLVMSTSEAAWRTSWLRRRSVGRWP